MQLEDNVKKSMEESLKKYYGVKSDKNVKHYKYEDITETWDTIQQSVSSNKGLACCLNQFYNISSLLLLSVFDI